MVLLRTTAERAEMSAVTAKAPTKAENRTAAYPAREREPADRLPPMPSMTTATARAAPLLMPNTSGPAKGLRKVVCNRSPLTARAAPPISAMKA